MPVPMTKRRGLSAASNKSPFANWLDSQLRSGLTYDVNVPNREGVGWTAEDFTYEAKARGLEGVRVQTTYKRRAGSVPNSEAMHGLCKAFPTIQF